MASYTGPPSRISLHVTFHIDPAKVTAFLDALKPAYDAVTAEPECVFFEVYQSAETPGLIKFVENWDASVEWLKTVSFYFATFSKGWEREMPICLSFAAGGWVGRCS